MVKEFLENQVETAGDSTCRVNWLQIRNSFARLRADQQEIAIDGIQRYLRACARMGVEVNYDAAKEIVTDAKNKRRVWEEQDAKTPEILRLVA